MPTSQIQSIDPNGSILFLGSGFSRQAKNIMGQHLPVGDELRDHLAHKLGVDPKEYDLKTISAEFDAHPELDLYQTLYEHFTVKDAPQSHLDILRMPWRRIYTTNYDDVVEFANTKLGKNAPVFDFNEDKPKRLPAGTIIHLHGSIRKTTEENVSKQLVLNENSYVRQHFEVSPWYDDFIRDLRFCTATFFVGYRLSDHHIAALLLKNPAIKEKTFFVTRNKPDTIFENRVRDYGTVLPIEVDGFAELCRTLPSPKASSDPHTLKAFRYVDPRADKKTLAQPTPTEIRNLVAFGTFNYQRCIATLPNASYVVPRQDLAAEGVEKLKTAKCLLVHSRLGNGKSVFLYILAQKLIEANYHCFFSRGNSPTLIQDLALLRQFDKLAIFFDSYDAAIDVIDQLTELPDATRLIVSVRTGTQEVRLHEIQARLPSPLKRLDLNGLDKQSRADFKELLDKAGVRVAGLEDAINRSHDIREIVVMLYDNAVIKSKVKTDYLPLFEDDDFRAVFVASHLLKWIAQEAEASFLRTVTGLDAFSAFSKVREIASDLFKLDDGELQVRSAIFSEYLIQNYFKTKDILDAIQKIIVESVKRKSERRYQATLSALMRVSTLKRALRRDDSLDESLIGLFENLRRDIGVNSEPLFWLQYSILMIEANDLPASESFLMTAYARAAASPGFQTYQIDTHALRLLLLIEEKANTSEPVKRFERIIELLEIVLSMVGNDSHRHYAVRVLEAIEPFVTARLFDLTRAEMNVLIFQFNRLMDALSRLPPEARAESGSDQTKASIDRAKARILSRP